MAFHYPLPEITIGFAAVVKMARGLCRVEACLRSLTTVAVVVSLTLCLGALLRFALMRQPPVPSQRGAVLFSVLVPPARSQPIMHACVHACKKHKQATLICHFNHATSTIAHITVIPCIAGALLQRPNDGSAGSAGSASNKYIQPITVKAPVMIKTTTVTRTENPVSAMLTARLQLGEATGGVISESDRCRLGFGGNAVFLGAGNYGESFHCVAKPMPSPPAHLPISHRDRSCHIQPARASRIARAAEVQAFLCVVNAKHVEKHEFYRCSQMNGAPLTHIDGVSDFPDILGRFHIPSQSS